MTIYKVLQNEKKPAKTAEDLEALVAGPLGEKKDGDIAVPKAVHITYRPRGSRTCLNLFLIVIALMVLGAGVIGGVYLYKYLTHKVFRARCGVELNSDLQPQPQYMDGEAKVHHAHYMQEDVEVRDQVFEEVRVPKFDECEDTLVLHDFERNYTAIVDRDDVRCFIMDLDRKLVSPPRDFIDLINKINTGYYMPRADIVRRKFRVVTPPIRDIKFLGHYIYEFCKNYDTFRLEKFVGGMFKRSVSEEMKRVYSFGVIAKGKVLKVDLFGLDGKMEQ